MSGPRHGRLAINVVLWILVATIGASAYRYGSVELGAAEWLRFVAIACVLILLWKESPKVLFSPSTRPITFAALAFFVWIALQVVPVPRGVIRALSPKTAATYENTVVPGGSTAIKEWLLDRARRDGVRLEEDATVTPGPTVEGDRTVGRTLSVYPFATRRAALAWIAPLLFFLVAARVATSHTARYRLLWGVAVWGGLCGLASVAQKLGWRGKPLWDVEDTGDFVSFLPFVNRNHLAGFLEMTTLVAIGLVLALLSRPTGRLDAAGIRRALTDRSWAVPRLLALGVLGALGTAGLVISGSRGGALAFLFGLVVLVLAPWLRRWVGALVVGVALLGVAVGAVGLSAPEQHTVEAGLAGGAEDASTVGRFDLWAKTLRMFVDHPLAGTGLGTFEWAFAGYKREGEWAKLDYPHNDYLQYVAETGLVGVVILIAGMAALLGTILSPALGGGSRRPRWTTIGAIAGVSAILAHSITDANLQIPANGALFAILLGVAAAAARDDESHSTGGAA